MAFFFVILYLSQGKCCGQSVLGFVYATVSLPESHRAGLPFVFDQIVTAITCVLGRLLRVANISTACFSVNAKPHL